MKVRILSGSQAGSVVEMSQLEAEVNLSTGFGELVPEPPVIPGPPTVDDDEADDEEAVAPEPEKRVRKKAKGRK